jgi:hypothetical protein
MNKDEINEYIHTQIMYKCWHDFGLYEKYKNPHLEGSCVKCKKAGERNPDYTSDDSPRRLLNEVVAKVRQRDELLKEFYDALLGLQLRDQYVIEATAEQIARACVEAHKSKQIELNFLHEGGTGAIGGVNLKKTEQRNTFLLDTGDEEPDRCSNCGFKEGYHENLLGIRMCP